MLEFMGAQQVVFEDVGLYEFKASKTYVNGVMTDDIEVIRHYISTKPHTKPLTWTNRQKPDWWET